MSDYHFETGVLRDQMASALANNTEQTGYVLAELAKAIPPGTVDFDDLVDGIANLEDAQMNALRTFCSALADALTPREAQSA